MGDMSVYNLESAFKNTFKPAIERCAASSDARVKIHGLAATKARESLKVVPGSIEPVTYWEGFRHKEKFIGGGVSGCRTKTNQAWVCHVMMKLSLMPESDSKVQEQFYVVGQLSMGNKIFGQHGAKWKHMSQFFLVDADKLQPSAEAGFELASNPNGEGKIDGRQLLKWSCGEPDVEPARADTEVVAPEPVAVASKKYEDVVNFEQQEALAIERDEVDTRCCCVEHKDQVLAMAVKFEFAVGHWGNAAGTKEDQHCPVVAIKKDDSSPVCGCTTKHLGFSWVAKTKCLTSDAEGNDFIGAPSHSPAKMESVSAQMTCVAKCAARDYVTTVTSACTD